MNEAQALFTLVNKMFGITYRDGRYWTGLYYKGNTSQIGDKTYRGIIATVLFGRY